MKRVVAITGGSGHLGCSVINELLKDDDTLIRAQYRSFLPPIKSSRLSWFKGDLSLESLNSLIEDTTVVIHSAARISIDGDRDGSVHKTNVEGTQNVIDACLRNGGTRLIHISSTHALQEFPHDEPFDEERPYKTSNNLAYDFSKAEGERLVKQAVAQDKLDAVILRPASLIGPPDYNLSLLGKAIWQFSKGKLPAVVTGGYSFVDVRDVARSVVSAIDNGVTGESYNLTGTYMQIGDVAKIAAKVGGSHPPFATLPHWVLKPFIPIIKLYSLATGAALPFTKDSLSILKNAHPNMVYTKAKNQLNHSPRPVKTTIEDLIKWLERDSNL
jgi:dihydroflavonol-4-reductase